MPEKCHRHTTIIMKVNRRLRQCDRINECELTNTYGFSNNSLIVVLFMMVWYACTIYYRYFSMDMKSITMFPHVNETTLKLNMAIRKLKQHVHYIGGYECRCVLQTFISLEFLFAVTS